MALLGDFTNIILLGCLIREFFLTKGKERLIYIVSILPLISFGMDVVMIDRGIWNNGNSSKYIFIVFFVAAMVMVLKIIPNNCREKNCCSVKKIANASVKLSNGDYNVEFVHSNVSEIELLNTAFENMATNLHEREEELHLFANRDSLKTTKFGVVVFDVNRLKETNDVYGHDTGDKLIVSVAKVISDVFKSSPVFRIGGDEFLAVLQHGDLEDFEKLLVQLDLECANTFVDEKHKINISIARGFTRFDSEKDLYFNDVFKRADYAMYENKRKSKEVTF